MSGISQRLQEALGVTSEDVQELRELLRERHAADHKKATGLMLNRGCWCGHSTISARCGTPCFVVGRLIDLAEVGMWAQEKK